MSSSSLSEELVTRINSSLSDSMSKGSSFPRSDISSVCLVEQIKLAQLITFFEPLVSLQPAQ